MKARTRVAAAILAFAALPLIVVNWASLGQRQADAARAGDLMLSAQAGEIAALLASTRVRWLESVRADARLPGVDTMLLRDPPPDAVQISRFFAAIGSRDPVNINAIGLLDLSGRVVEDSRAVNVGRDESDTPWMLGLLASGQPRIVGPLVPEGDDVPGLFIVAVVRDRYEKRQGVLRVRLEPALLGQVMGAALLAWPELSASLVDASGSPVAGIGRDGKT